MSTFEKNLFHYFWLLFLGLVIVAHAAMARAVVT
jgi:hypothetical protein